MGTKQIEQRTEETDYIEDEKGDEHTESRRRTEPVAGMSAAEARRPGGGAMRVRRGQGLCSRRN